VHPAALPAGSRPDFAGSLPEAERAIGNCQLRPRVEPAPFQIEQQFTPILGSTSRARGIGVEEYRPI